MAFNVVDLVECSPRKNLAGYVENVSQCTLVDNLCVKVINVAKQYEGPLHGLLPGASNCPHTHELHSLHSFHSC